MSQIQIACLSPQQTFQDISNVLWPHIKNHLIAGKRGKLTFVEEGRNVDQNKILHAMIGYISKNMEWAGKRRDLETWKRLLVAAWCRARNEHIEILPALDGHGVDIVYLRTSKLTKAECSELIEYIYAWGVQNDIPIPVVEAPRRIDMETGEIL